MKTFLAKRGRWMLGATLCLAAASGVSACGKTTTTPGIMLSFSSDMSVPKDVTAVGLYIRSRGTVLYNQVVDAEVDPTTGQRTVRFPSTFAIRSDGNAATVRVQLIAYGPKTEKGRKALVMRDTTSGVPTDRLSLLRMPLLWINQGSVSRSGTVAPTGISPLSAQGSTVEPLEVDEVKSGIPDTGYPGACAEGQTYIGGQCRASDTIPLEDYTEENDPDNPNGTCFSVEKCFATPTALRYDDKGVVDIGTTDPKTVNLALITKDGFGIKLPDGRFAISLNANSPLEGYSIEKGKIVLSPGALKVLQSGAATSLIATAVCEPKSDSVGNCGEWNQKNNSITPKPNAPPAAFPDAGLDDAGPIADGGFDSGFDGGPPDGGPPDGGPPDGGPPDGGGIGPGERVSVNEPRVMGLGVAATSAYFIRNGNAQVGFEASLVASMLPPPGNGMGSSAPEPLSTNMTQANGYRLFYFNNPPGLGGINFENRQLLFSVNPGLSLVYNYQIGAATAPASMTPVAGFTPYYVAMSDGVDANGGPIVFGAKSGGPHAYIYSNNVAPPTAANITGVNSSEGIISGVTFGANNYYVGTDQGRLLYCVKGALNANVVCTEQKGTQANEVVADVIYSGGKAYFLVVNSTASEQNFEGVYSWDGIQVAPIATRANYGNVLHFEQFSPLGSNHIATDGNYIYVTTGARAGLKSRVMAVPIAGGVQPITVADGMFAAREIVFSATHVYYTEYGDGSNNNNGGIYRSPKK